MSDPKHPTPDTRTPAEPPPEYVLQQPYPGAPPTYAPAPFRLGAAPPGVPAPGRSGMAVTALVLGILGVVFGLIPFAGAVLVAPLVVATVVFAVIALTRPGSSRALPVVALLLAGAAVVLTVSGHVARPAAGSWPWEPPVPEGAPSLPSPPPPHDIVEPQLPPLLGLQDDVVGGSSRADALPYGTTVTLIDDTTGAEIWALTVTAPQDVTAAASETPGSTPDNGAYVAVPVELTNLTDEPVDLSSEDEYALFAWLLTGDGGRADPLLLTDSPYPTAWDIGAIQPGETAQYYEVFDVASGVTGSGLLVADLPAGGQVFWGPPG